MEYVLKYPEPCEMFTHLDTDGVLRMFFVGTMRLFAEDYPKCPGIKFIRAPIDERLIQHLEKKAGIEDERIARLTEPYISRPAIGIMWPDDTTTIVDGNHRAVALWRKGVREFPMVIFACGFWKHFTLTDEEQARAIELKPDPLNTYSGIIEVEKKLGRSI